MKNIVIKNLGFKDYREIWDLMQNFTNNRTSNTEDEIWLVEHPSVFTQGKAGKMEHILNPGDIPVINVDRGGQVTYHGPGQIIIYVLFDLRRAKMGVKKFVANLEDATIEALADYGIRAEKKEKAPGIYVNGAKICSLGLRIKRSGSYHGLALNVAANLEPFSRINPCGFKNLKMVNMADFVAADKLNLEEVGAKVAKYVSQKLVKNDNRINL
jgi:lipoyl(octanoyl) transferase